MKIRKDKLISADKFIFFFNWFLDLNDHFRAIVNFLRIVNHFATSFHVCLIAESTSYSGSSLYQNNMATFYKFLCTSGSKGYTVFVIFNFFRDTNYHTESFLGSRANIAK